MLHKSYIKTKKKNSIKVIKVNTYLFFITLKSNFE